MSGALAILHVEGSLGLRCCAWVSLLRHRVACCTFGILYLFSGHASALSSMAYVPDCC